MKMQFIGATHEVTGSRYNTEDILASQNTLKEDHGTLILGNYGE